MNIKWNVYRYNFNTKKIELFNIFKHGSFYESIKKLFKKYKDKTEFAENLRKELLYYFWCKYEYEVIITTFPVYIDEKELERINNNSDSFYKMDIVPKVGIKEDIYSQVMNNFDIFADYVWNNKKEFK